MKESIQSTKTRSAIGFIRTVMYGLLLANTTLALAATEKNTYPLGERSIMSERAIQARIAPSSKICLEGETCTANTLAANDSATPALASAPVSSEKATPEAHFNQYCAACHTAGIAGAPKIDDKAAWDARMAKGMDAVVATATAGINAMPPKGMCAECSAEDLKEIIEYMVGLANK